MEEERGAARAGCRGEAAEESRPFRPSLLAGSLQLPTGFQGNKPTGSMKMSLGLPTLGAETGSARGRNQCSAYRRPLQTEKRGGAPRA